jgi:hypothetical protein
VDPDDPNADRTEFFVLLCTRKMYVVEDEVATDNWGRRVEREDEVVEGVYYHRKGNKPNS